MRKNLIKFTLVLLCSILILGGCGISPKQTLKTGFAKTEDVKSYTFNSELILHLDLPQSVIATDPTIGAYYQSLKDVKVLLNGTYEKSEERLEMTLSAELKGDISMTLNVPIIVKGEKAWIKVPNTPFLPLPEQMIGKYVSFDVNEFSKQNDIKETEKSKRDDAAKEFSEEIAALFLKEYDEKTYFKVLKKDEADIPDKTDIDEIVRISVNDKNLESFALTTIEKVAPKAIELYEKFLKDASISNTEDMGLKETKEEIAKMKPDNVKKGIAEFHEEGKLDYFNVDFGINDEKYIIFERVDTLVQVKDTTNNSWSKVGVKATQSISNINKDVKFKYGIPDSKDTITLQELLTIYFLGSLGSDEIPVLE
ncbi:MAG: hypothetical protein K0R18_1358 [Bacillales bacterium]|jgi:hypothetical protein|nr:hypothetical protein [Bacillales bacterium]